MSRYIPQPAYPEKMPVDISSVFEDEKPAGKHGFLQVAGEEFCFTDGTPARFWGVNPEGFYTGKMHSVYEDGVLTFKIGDEMNPACYYLVVGD